MSTNASIVIWDTNPEVFPVRAIYLHWDGHIESAGKKLLTYDTYAKVQLIFRLGDVSSLKEFENRHKTQFFSDDDYFDNDDTDHMFRTYTGLAECYRREKRQYNYVFAMSSGNFWSEQKWLVFENDYTKMRSLIDEVRKL
jgi:hypothetical protein